MKVLATPSDYRLFQPNRTTKSSTPRNYQYQNLSQKLRSISSKFLAKATKTRWSKKSTPRYIPIVEPPPARRSGFDSSDFPDCSAGTKHDSLAKSTIIPVVPANPLSTTIVVVITSPTDSLEMKSKVAVTSRGGSNQSTSQSFIDAYLARRKREEINELMIMVEKCLDSLDITSNAHGAGDSSRRPTSNHSNSSGSSAGTPENNSQKRPRPHRDSFDDPDPGRDGNDQDKRAGKRTRLTPCPTLKLACPFFKRDPSKYKGRQACTGPGWSSISRLKEHIYRAHRQPDNKCNRCYEVFQSGDQLEDHQRLEVPCMVSQDKSIDGINESQYIALRKKPVGKKGDVERWEEVYRTIFPKATVIPSAYYDYEESNRIAIVSYDSMKALEEQLIHGVRNDLEDQFDQFADEQRHGLVKIVEDRFKQIIEQWTDNNPGTEPRAMPLEAAQVPPLPNFDDIDFEFLLNGPDMSSNYELFPTDTVTGDFFCPSEVSDSAYVSMDSPGSPRKVGA